MNVTLWIVASLLGAVFAAAGATKLTTPREHLIPKMALVADFTDSQVNPRVHDVDVTGMGRMPQEGGALVDWILRNEPRWRAATLEEPPRR